MDKQFVLAIICAVIMFIIVIAVALFVHEQDKKAFFNAQFPKELLVADYRH